MLILVNRWFKKIKIFGLVVVPIVLLMLGQGALLGSAAEPLRPNFKSWWLWIHVIFAWFAYSAFAVGGGLGLIYLLKQRAGESEAKIWQLFPELDMIDDLILRFISFGFISQTVMLISGSIWANSLWGAYWNWDPLETWSLVTWITYGVILHFKLTLGWKGNRIAWLVFAAIFTEIITFYGIGFISNLHTPLLQ
jgi:cytochrome c-type biogenesis protein CcsB